jgi:hypothetical protein
MGDNSRKYYTWQECLGVLCGSLLYMNRSTIAKKIVALQSNLWYALFLVVLAFTGLGLLLYEFTPYARPEIIQYTVRLDLVIACIFLTDFLLGLAFNTTYTPREYWRKNWLDFISSIPITSDVARALRILRAVRAIRVISSILDIWFTQKRYRELKSKAKENPDF